MDTDSEHGPNSQGFNLSYLRPSVPICEPIVFVATSIPRRETIQNFIPLSPCTDTHGANTGEVSFGPSC
jgi:hypothetical protein